MRAERSINSLVSCFLIGFCIHATASLKLPSYIKPCSIKDPHVDECGKRHGNEAIPTLVKGDPTYRIPVLDPLLVTEIRVEDTSTASATSLSIVISNLTIRGLASSKILDRVHDFQKRSIYTEFIAPKLDVTSVYNISGRVLALTINGNGECNLKLDNLRVKYTLYYEFITKKDGKKYYSMTDSHMTYNVTGGQIYLTNLFNGDKTLADGMNRFLNENFLDVFAQVGPSIAESLNELFKRINGNIFRLIPFEEFYTDLPSHDDRSHE